MSRTDPGGLSDGTTVKGWIRTDAEGDYVPCGCGGIQRPAPDRLCAVQAEYDAADAGVEIQRVFVCEREDCSERTVQQRAAEAVMEGDR